MFETHCVECDALIELDEPQTCLETGSTSFASCPSIACHKCFKPIICNDCMLYYVDKMMSGTPDQIHMQIMSTPRAPGVNLFKKYLDGLKQFNKKITADEIIY